MIGKRHTEGDIMTAITTLAAVAMLAASWVSTPEDGTASSEISYESRHAVTLDETLHRGWPVSLGSPGAGFPYTPLLYDIDEDGACEIFLTGGHTFGLSGDGQFLPGWPVQEMAYMGYASTGQLPGPSAEDMNGDGEIEIMWSTRDWYAGSAHLWTFNGRAENGSDLAGYPLSAPDQSSNALSIPFVLGDADGNGTMEAVTAHTLGNTGDYYRISGLDFSGNILFTTDLNTTEDILNIYFGDADGNGMEEFFAVTLFSGDFRLHLLNPDGSHQSGYPVSIHTPGGGSLMFGPPVVADLDGNGDLEMILGYNSSSTSRAMAVNHDGTPVAGFPINISSGSQLFYLGMGDVTGDGEPELIAVDNELSADYRVWAIDMVTGAPLSGWPVDVASWPKGFPAVADLDGDGIQDISFSTDGGTVHALSGAGVELEGFPKAMSAASTSGTAVGDIDGDGYYELVAATWDGWVYAWDTEGPVETGNRDWPMRGVDPANTGIYRGAGQSGTGESPVPVSLSIAQNPVSSAAVFTVTGVQNAGQIQIFDTAGRLAASVYSVWNPSADQPGGVYLARLSGSSLPAVKFVLVR